MPSPDRDRKGALPDGVPRWHPRYQVEASADIAGDGVLLYHPIRNLSLGGLCIRTPSPEPIGSRLSVTLSLPDVLTPVHVVGEVVWVSRGAPGTMGLRWIGLTGSQKRLLAGALARRQARELSQPGDAGERPSA